MVEHFIQRCFDLAALGKQHTAPNPSVGAVLVYQDKIIGEGYHQKYGEAHAEVNAVNSVRASERHLISQSTLYVSLEPCNIQGNTPPCTRLITREKIPRVVISYIDHTPGVDGEGIQYLRSQGVEVITGVLERQGIELNAPRNTFVQKNRPYIILKYAQSANGIFAPLKDRQLWLTNQYSKRLVHRWRSETQAILVGQNTVSIDNPRLNNRLYYGPSPLRVVLGEPDAIPNDSHVLEERAPTLFFTTSPSRSVNSNTETIQCPAGKALIPCLLKNLAGRKISTLLVEGGIHTLNQFIQQQWWDEARVFIAPVYLNEGRAAPTLDAPLRSTHQLDTDQLLIFKNEASQSLNFH
jgi:diaminohydroxyphosphoribosylaminopyrimidine deaminase/5-amino-6-(5-phosphoribosylamino)uracil reductase